jgi:hypothetical protein
MENAASRLRSFLLKQYLRRLSRLRKSRWAPLSRSTWLVHVVHLSAFAMFLRGDRFVPIISLGV